MATSRNAKAKSRSRAAATDAATLLDERQSLVLRTLVSAFVADATPVSSSTLSHLMPVSLSTASIRSTMAQLAELGLIEQPHTSAGRVPTEKGLRLFLDRLIDPGDITEYERRLLEERVGEGGGEALLRRVSKLLSERTRQIGFALEPRVERLPLAHVSLVRVSTERVLVVLVARGGEIVKRTVDERGRADQRELDEMARVLNERLQGRTLVEVHDALVTESITLRNQADRLLERALLLGLRALDARAFDARDLVVATRLAVLDQPEFADPDRIRGVLAALETHERLVEVLGRVLEREGVTVSLGDDLAEPGLRDCAMVAVPYGDRGPGRSGEGRALGVIGVIGPNRMDYGRIIPVVSYCSRLVTEKLYS